MHKVMWLLIRTILYCLEINDILLPIIYESFFCQPVHALGKVLQELDLQEFAQFFACSQPSPDWTLPEWGNRWQRGQMTTTETSFLVDDSQIIDTLWSYCSQHLCSLECHPWCQQMLSVPVLKRMIFEILDNLISIVEEVFSVYSFLVIFNFYSNGQNTIPFHIT